MIMLCTGVFFHFVEERRISGWSEPARAVVIEGGPSLDDLWMSEGLTKAEVHKGPANNRCSTTSGKRLRLRPEAVLKCDERGQARRGESRQGRAGQRD